MTLSKIDRNFRLRTRPGDGIYEVVWIDPVTDRQRRRSTGTRDEVEARLCLDQIAAEGRITRPKAGVTVGELINDYRASFERAQGRRQISIVAMRSTLKPLTERLGALRWDQITQEIVDDYIQWRLAQPAWENHSRKVTAPDRTVGPSTVNKDLRMLRAVLNDAHARRAFPHPVSFRINISAEPPREEWLTKAEVQLMLAACETRASVRNDEGRVVIYHREREHLEAFILLSIATAARKEAVLSLTWNQVHIPKKEDLPPGMPVIDFANGKFNGNAYIDFGSGRGNKRRPKMPVGQNARLMAYLAFGGDRSQPYVVSFRGKPVRDIKKGFAELLAEAGIKKKVTPHSLKHTAITWMVQSGMSLETISELTRTSVETLRRVYAHHRPDYQAALGGALSIA